MPAIDKSPYGQARHLLLFLLLPKSKMDHLPSFRARDRQVSAWRMRYVSDNGQNTAQHGH